MAISATRSECRAVYGDLASITRANALAIRSSASSSARTTWSGGLDLAHELVHLVRGELRPELRVALDRLEHAHKLGIEPGATPLARHADGGCEVLADGEDIDGLRETENAPEQGDLLASRP